jgi:hypothetical protein
MTDTPSIEARSRRDVTYTLTPTGDREIDTLRLCVLALNNLDDPATVRVVRYLYERYPIVPAAPERKT